MDGAVFLGTVQSPVTYVMYWLRKASTTEHSRDLRHYIQYDDGSNILCALHCLFHQCHPDHGLAGSELQGEGKVE